MKGAEGGWNWAKIGPDSMEARGRTVSLGTASSLGPAPAGCVDYVAPGFQPTPVIH